MTEPTKRLIARIAAMPHTHKVVTTYVDGHVREFTTRSEQSAQNHAVLDRRNIGRVMLERYTNREVCIVSVDVVAL